MCMSRSLLYQAGPVPQEAAKAITIVRGVQNGMPEVEQDIAIDGRANFAPSDERGIAFTRTLQQVLRIVYLTPETGVNSGGFFPNGVNGGLASTYGDARGPNIAQVLSIGAGRGGVPDPCRS